MRESIGSNGCSFKESWHECIKVMGPFLANIARDLLSRMGTEWSAFTLTQAMKMRVSQDEYRMF